MIQILKIVTLLCIAHLEIGKNDFRFNFQLIFELNVPFNGELLPDIVRYLSGLLQVRVAFRHLSILILLHSSRVNPVCHD